MEVSFNQNRCHFAPFTKENDEDPATHRCGVRYYKFSFRLIAAIYKRLGIAEKMTTLDGEVVYVNRRSLVKWLNRHKEVAPNQAEFADWLKKGNFQTAIKMICANYRPRTKSVEDHNPSISSLKPNLQVRNEEGSRDRAQSRVVGYVSSPVAAKDINQIQKLDAVLDELTGSSKVAYDIVHSALKKVSVICPVVVNDRFNDPQHFRTFIAKIRENSPHAKIILLVIFSESNRGEDLDSFGEDEVVRCRYRLIPDMSGLGGGTTCLLDENQVLADLKAVI